MYIYICPFYVIQEFGGESWLEDLKKVSYTDAKKALQLLPGIGPKVFVQ